MSGVLYPDLARSFALGSQLRVQEEERGIDKEVNELVPAAMKGDQAAIENIARKRPNVAMGITGMLDKMDAGRRAKVKEASQWTAQAAMGILSLPEAERPAAYQAALSEGQLLGYQIDMPPQYDRAVEGRLNQVINQARPISDYFKGQDEGVTYAAPGGGAAPPSAGPGGSVIDRSSAASASIESGAKGYSAVGPVANSKGNRAYGKHQVMDFNIGPWTQEVLGRAMTPQEFINDPKAQDAVYNVKMGQYIKKYGSPEAASRAWFAGEGGMNNPGAKDVLGTTVQAYGDKFAEAYGPGARTAQPPGLAQGDAAPRADASGNPLPPQGQEIPREATRGMQLPPGYLVGMQRGKIISPVPGYIQVMPPGGGAPILWPVPQVKEKQAPAGYRFAPDGNSLQAIPGGPADKPKEPGTGPFAGTGTEAQALNMLIANGTLTQQQAAELAAGKTVTDPETKQIIFMTPSGIFGGRPGQPPQPITGPSPGMAAPAPMPSAGAPAGVPAPASPAVTVPANPGALPLTGTQSKGQPSATEMAKLRSARVEADKITAAANDFKTEWAKATPAERARSLAGANTPLNASYNNFALLAKGDALFQLGVLNGPDLDIIRRTIPDPSTWKSIMTSENDVTSSVDKVLNILNNGVSSTERQLGITPPQGAQGKQTAKPGIYMGPDNNPISWPEIEATAKNRGITTDEVVKRLGLKPTGMQ